MTNLSKTGGPAFAVPATQYNRLQEGMTLRDYFAGQALPETIKASWSQELTVHDNARIAAIWAYDFADAMLKARGEQ